MKKTYRLWVVKEVWTSFLTSYSVKKNPDCKSNYWWQKMGLLSNGYFHQFPHSTSSMFEMNSKTKCNKCTTNQPISGSVSNKSFLLFRTRCFKLQSIRLFKRNSCLLCHASHTTYSLQPNFALLAPIPTWSSCPPLALSSFTIVPTVPLLQLPSQTLCLLFFHSSLPSQVNLLKASHVWIWMPYSYVAPLAQRKIY